jgi:tetratricopeptide (TPR) repeat protein
MRSPLAPPAPAPLRLAGRDDRRRPSAATPRLAAAALALRAALALSAPPLRRVAAPDDRRPPPAATPRLADAVRALRAALAHRAGAPRRLALAAAASLATAGPAAATDYDACLAGVARDPQAGLVAAEAWKARGGGEAAEHCAAMALASQGAWRAAAARLGELATRSTAPAATVAEMLGQASSFWLEAGDAGLARATADRAVTLAPADPWLKVTRAEAAAAEGRWAAAAADLTRALVDLPEEPVVLALRAAALRGQGDHAAALRDATAAVALDPGAALALFEKGAAEAALGRREAARESWLDAIAAEPDSPVAEQARASLQAMDAP